MVTLEDIRNRRVESRRNFRIWAEILGVNLSALIAAIPMDRLAKAERCCRMYGRMLTLHVAYTDESQM